MDKQELIDKVNVALAEEFEIEITKITPDADIKETLDLDSLSLVDMVALIENLCSVEIKGQDITSIRTFENLYNFIIDRMQ
ncbi:MAG: phosphopantetheine-binding protein [Bacteroidales bacterium]|jgi:acyl carrier protein|nr:phosphopantetheine-binding protein [Bacteroidales bacterium]